jgi:hypothetical protein
MKGEALSWDEYMNGVASEPSDEYGDMSKASKPTLEALMNTIASVPAKDLEPGTRILIAEAPYRGLREETVEKVTTDEVSGYSLIWAESGIIFPRLSETLIITPSVEQAELVAQALAV